MSGAFASGETQVKSAFTSHLETGSLGLIQAKAMATRGWAGTEPQTLWVGGASGPKWDLRGSGYLVTGPALH